MTKIIKTPVDFSSPGFEVYFRNNDVPVVALMEDKEETKEYFQHFADELEIQTVHLANINEAVSLTNYFIQEVQPNQPRKRFAMLFDIHMGKGRSKEGISALRKIGKQDNRSFPLGCVTGNTQYKKEVAQIGCDFWFEKKFHPWRTCLETILDHFQSKELKQELKTAEEKLLEGEKQLEKKREEVLRLSRQLENLDINKKKFNELMSNEEFVEGNRGKFILVSGGEVQMKQEGKVDEFFSLIREKFENADTYVAKVPSSKKLVELRTRRPKVEYIL